MAKEGKLAATVDRSSPEGRLKASRRALAGTIRYDDPRKNLGDSKSAEPISLTDPEAVAKSAARLSDAFIAFNVDETSPDAWRDLALGLLVTFTPAFRIQTRTTAKNLSANDDRDYEFICRVADLIRSDPEIKPETAEKVIYHAMCDDCKRGQSEYIMPTFSAMKKMRQRRFDGVTAESSPLTGPTLDAFKNHSFLKRFDETQMIEIFQEAASRIRPTTMP
jgi:hypothetical protein